MLEYKFIIEEKRAVCFDDGIEIGECDFFEEGNSWNIIHTGVNSKYQGQGIARKLVELVIQKAKEFGKDLDAECSYAKKILDNI